MSTINVVPFVLLVLLVGRLHIPSSPSSSSSCCVAQVVDRSGARDDERNAFPSNFHPLFVSVTHSTTSHNSHVLSAKEWLLFKLMKVSSSHRSLPSTRRGIRGPLLQGFRLTRVGNHFWAHTRIIRSLLIIFCFSSSTCADPSLAPKYLVGSSSLFFIIPNVPPPSWDFNNYATFGVLASWMTSHRTRKYCKAAQISRRGRRRRSDCITPSSLLGSQDYIPSNLLFKLVCWDFCWSSRIC